MRVTEVRRYAMLVRVKDFGEGHRGLFPESTEGGRAFAAVAEAVAQLNAHAASKMSTARDGRRAKQLARKALVERLETIGRTARAIAEQTPGFDDPFHLPKKQTDAALLTAGRVFGGDAEACRARFIGHGLADTFVADLKGLVDTFEQTIREREAGKTTQATAQAGIASALLSGLAAVRQLDVIVPNQLAGDPAGIAGWERDRRVEYPSRRAKTTTAEPAPAGSAPQAIGSAPAPAAPPAAGVATQSPVPAANTHAGVTS